MKQKTNAVNSAIIRVSFELTGYNAIDGCVNAFVYRELSHMRVGYYAISVTSVKIKICVKRPISPPPNLTLCLLRDFL